MSPDRSPVATIRPGLGRSYLVSYFGSLDGDGDDEVVEATSSVTKGRQWAESRLRRLEGLEGVEWEADGDGRHTGWIRG